MDSAQNLSQGCCLGFSLEEAVYLKKIANSQTSALTHSLWIMVLEGAIFNTVVVIGWIFSYFYSDCHAVNLDKARKNVLQEI